MRIRLTDAQVDALQCPAHVDFSLLQQVRNTFGPSWLMRYRLPKLPR